jgi:hypothetical protein
MDVQKRGSIFAKCNVCKSLKDLISKVGKNNPCVKDHEIKLKKIPFTRNLVGIDITPRELNRMQSKENFLCVIHDKMDHSKIVPPWHQMRNKMVYELGQLQVTLTGTITHGHGDKAFVQCSNEF